MKTTREIFNIVKNHLLTQKVVAQDRAGGCVYRDEEGNKCAVGCLIERGYDSLIEGVGLIDVKRFVENETTLHTDLKVQCLVDSLRKNDVDVYDEETLNLLSQLQYIHDEVAPFLWEESLHDLEKEFLSV